MAIKLSLSCDINVLIKVICLVALVSYAASECKVDDKVADTVHNFAHNCTSSELRTLFLNLTFDDVNQLPESDKLYRCHIIDCIEPKKGEPICGTSFRVFLVVELCKQILTGQMFYPKVADRNLTSVSGYARNVDLGIPMVAEHLSVRPFPVDGEPVLQISYRGLILGGLVSDNMRPVQPGLYLGTMMSPLEPKRIQCFFTLSL